MTRHEPGCQCTRCCDLDALREQPRQYVEAATAYRTELHGMSAEQRRANCGHTLRNPHTGVCPDCGDTIDL